MRVLIYALGGGLGHFTRAMALARTLVRCGHGAELLCNSALLNALPGLIRFTPPEFTQITEGVTITSLQAYSEKIDLLQEIRSRLQGANPDLLVVDTFPRGLLGELPALLPQLSCPKALIHRELNPEYVRRYAVEEALAFYRLLLVPGEQPCFSAHPRAVITPPWLIRDAVELLSPLQARAVLLQTDEESSNAEAETSPVPLIVVCGSGSLAESQELRAWAEETANTLTGKAHCIYLGPLSAAALPLPTAVWPLLGCMRGIDLLIGGAGYNLVQEAHATQTPLLALPRPRLYDRQALRLRPEEQVDALALPMRVREFLSRYSSEFRTAPTYENGTWMAVRMLEKAVNDG